MSYTKLASSILTSTLWMESDHTRIVWFALMAMADKNGEVSASIPGLANIARVPLESCRVAIARFLSPDPDSRTKTDEGRRIEEIRGGWVLVNHAEYREHASSDDKARKAAERQQRVRDRISRDENSHASVTPRHASVTPRHATEEGVTPKSRLKCHADAFSEADAAQMNTEKTEEREALPPQSPPAPRSKRFIPPTVADVEAYALAAGHSIDAVKFVAHYESVDWVRGKTKISNWKMAVVTWTRNNFDKAKAEPVASQDEMAWDASPDIEFALKVQAEVRAAQAAKALSK